MSHRAHFNCKSDAAHGYSVRLPKWPMEKAAVAALAPEHCAVPDCNAELDRSFDEESTVAFGLHFGRWLIRHEATK